MSIFLLGEDVAPGFDDPVGLLLACHDRVRHYADLLQRLVAHVGRSGVDDEARTAARAVLRYFDVAAPLHHEDEEKDLYPLLRGRVPAGVAQLMDAISSEHEEFGLLWDKISPSLRLWATGAPAEIDVLVIDRFCDLYVSHAHTEEQEIFSRARDLLSKDELVRLGESMRARRQAGA